MDSYLSDGLNRVISFCGVIAITLLTLWIMPEGCRIMAGQSRTPLLGLVLQASKTVVIVAISGALYNDWVAGMQFKIIFFVRH